MHRGGAETMIMNLYRQIDRTKVQFDFAVHTNKKMDYDDEIIRLGGKIYSFPSFSGTNIIEYRRAWKSFFDEHNEYNVVHGHIGSSASIYLKIANNRGCYTIAHSHNTNSISKNLKNIIYPYFAYPTRFIADFFIGCSRMAGVDRFGEKVVSSKDKFAVLNNAIKTEHFVFSKEKRNLMRKELGIDNQLTIGHIGRFNKQKNHMFLLNIFKYISIENPNSVLLLVGDGELRSEIEDKIEQLGLSNNVVLTGVRSDIHDLLQAMDIFLFPSLYEGLPVTLIEAQASGLRCFISDSITNEVQITDLIKSISIDKSPMEWATEVLNNKSYVRYDTSKSIKSSGFDIKETAIWLEKFYLEKSLIKN